MKNTVFTLMTALVLSTTTCLAQSGSGRGSYNRDNGRQQYTERGMNNYGRMDRGSGGQNCGAVRRTSGTAPVRRKCDERT